MSLSASPLHVLICPAGDFQDMGDDCGGYIMITALDGSGNGIPNIPWTDFWLDACDGAQALYLCAGAVTADSMTNSLGQTTISDPISGGGCITSGGVFVAIQNNQILESPDCTDPVCLDMEIKSPDLTANGIVDLTDFSQFGNAYGSSSGDTNYDDCCDFNNDNAVGLSDFSLFGNHYQHECQ
ncbi:hypothetical protein J7M07_04565 [bacterium]|nr:hypothetical protein [bacterium]